MNLFLGINDPLSRLGFNLDDFMSLSLVSFRKVDSPPFPIEKKKDSVTAKMEVDLVESASKPSLPPVIDKPIEKKAIPAAVHLSRKHLHDDDKSDARKRSNIACSFFQAAPSRKHAHESDEVEARKKTTALHDTALVQASVNLS